MLRARGEEIAVLRRVNGEDSIVVLLLLLLLGVVAIRGGDGRGVVETGV